ncbi:hypothetical protein [Desulfatiglans anilini]|uniref:hypothetical protein n=1 Tax=Desulfatiglans anilini TaxID=90728 RepID=UPI000406AF40|nr:hypothetical protein [Desulfatiglans anilini]
MNDWNASSPAKILSMSSQGGLGRGNLGAVVARAGVGKTACLIHIGLKRLLEGERVVHISLKEGPDKVSAYYALIFAELARTLPPDEQKRLQAVMEKKRMILAYLNQSFDVARLRANLVNLRDHLGFSADLLMIDGLDFEQVSREDLEAFKAFAAEWGVEIWFSVLSHRHLHETNARGVPQPLDALDDFFGVILQLHPEPSGIYLKFLKDHDAPAAPEASWRLDPNTYLVLS